MAHNRDVPVAYLPNVTIVLYCASSWSQTYRAEFDFFGGGNFCGKNAYGHPNKDTLRVLESKHMKVYRTDYCGDIIYEQGRVSCPSNR